MWSPNQIIAFARYKNGWATGDVARTKGEATPMPADGNPRMIGYNRQSNVTKPINVILSDLLTISLTHYNAHV